MSGWVKAQDARQTVGKTVSLRRSQQGSVVTVTPHSELDPDYIFSSEQYKLLDHMALGSPLLNPFLFLTFFFSGWPQTAIVTADHENNWVLMLWLVRG